MTTLKDQIAADVTTVILNTDEHAEQFTHYPGGLSGTPATVTGVVVFDDEDGSRREFEGDGLALDGDRGRKMRTSGVAEIPSSVSITPEVDIFEIDSVRYVVTRITGHDADMQAVAFARRARKTSRKSQTKT